MDNLPEFSLIKLAPTRDYLREISLILSGLQRAFMPEHPRQWQYGLEVNMRGLVTQSFKVNGVETGATLDLVRQKVRLCNEKWSLRENPPAQILTHIKSWLKEQNIEVDLDEPDFVAGTLEYDPAQAEAYAQALWWLEEQFRSVKSSLNDGVTAPILLYPHHFDLSLVWFPWDDERQVSIGWSTGDETIKESYLYLTAYPEPKGFTSLELPTEAYWQKEGFSGAILPYAKLAANSDPAELFQKFSSIIPSAKTLF